MRNSPQRLAELRRHLLLDSTVEQAYDDLARLLANALEVPITMVNFLDEERDWVKSVVGLSMSESPVATSFCEVFFSTSDEVVVVEDTQLDPRFAAHPLVKGAPHIRFYAAARLKVDGHTLGTLCAYDTRTHKVQPEQVQTLQALAAAAVELIRRKRP